LTANRGENRAQVRRTGGTFHEPARTIHRDEFGRRTDLIAPGCVFSSDASYPSQANRSCYNLTTVLTTTHTDMSVLSRTHGRCRARREGRQRVGANEHERAATYSYTAWRRVESCRGHQTRNHTGLHGWGRTHTVSLTALVLWAHGQTHLLGDASERRRPRTALPSGT
jgi:hypothetical protein